MGQKSLIKSQIFKQICDLFHVQNNLILVQSTKY